MYALHIYDLKSGENDTPKKAIIKASPIYAYMKIFIPLNSIQFNRVKLEQILCVNALQKQSTYAHIFNFVPILRGTLNKFHRRQI